MEYLVINYIKVYRTLAPGQYHLKGAVKLLAVPEIHRNSSRLKRFSVAIFKTIWPQHIPWIDFENKRDGTVAII